MAEELEVNAKPSGATGWHALWRSTPRATPRWLVRLELVFLSLMLAGLAAIVLGGWRLDSRYDDATYLLSELDELERAGQRWAEETGAAPGTVVGYDEVRTHIRPPTRQLAKRGTDPLGHPWPGFRVGEGHHPRVAPASWDELTPVMGEAFWEPYRCGEGEPPMEVGGDLRPPQHH